MTYKRTIRGRLYDIDTATELYTMSQPGDKKKDDWMTQALFRKRNGEYFIFGRGGSDSIYRKQGTDGRYSDGWGIEPLKTDEARSWAKTYMPAGLYDDLFGNQSTTHKSKLTLSVSDRAIEQLKQLAADQHMSLSETVENLVLTASNQTDF